MTRNSYIVWVLTVWWAAVIIFVPLTFWTVVIRVLVLSPAVVVFASALYELVQDYKSLIQARINERR